MGLFTYTFVTMTIAPASLVAEFAGGTSNDVDMMIGVGVVKDSDAVYFQYLGEEQTPRALTVPTSGKPVFNLVNIRVVGLEVADDIGTFKSTKLNVYIESAQGSRVMLTSGLNTYWSQCVITGLMGLFDSYSIDTPFTLNTWKGTQGLKPCFASIKLGKEKISDQSMYDQLKDLRSDGNSKRMMQVLREAVNIISAAIGGGEVEPVVVAVAPAADEIEDEF